MAALRIFSYLPNPRVWKATIAARFCGVEVEVRGASGKELRDWLWDYDAHPLSEQERAGLASLARTGKVGLTGAQLFKTDAFMAAHPFGNVPAALGADGNVGIFESNSIMRAVARLGAAAFSLYGRDAYEASRIDSFLDVSLVFARTPRSTCWPVGRHGRPGDSCPRQGCVRDLCIRHRAGPVTTARDVGWGRHRLRTSALPPSSRCS